MTRQTRDALIEQLVLDTNYIINEDGTIRHVTKQNIVKKDQKGKLVVHYADHYLSISRIIFRKFNGSIDSGKNIMHVDGNTSNNAYSNLAYAAAKTPRTKAPYKKFDDEQLIADIRFQSSWLSVEVLARNHKLTKDQVRYILRRKTHKHIQ
jgi:hypothetical protein